MFKSRAVGGRNEMFADLRYDLYSGQESVYNGFMESVYQNTFWLIVAVLAVLLPLYVLAVSLLGRAIRIAREQKRAMAAEQEQRAKTETEEAGRELEKGKTDAARERLNLAKKEEEEATKQLKRVDKRYNLLTLRCCVIIPGALLLAAAVLSALAESFTSRATSLSALFWIAISSWSLSLVLMGVAGFRLIRALSVVQEISLSSDETALRRTTEALKTALSEVEEGKRPELDFTWWKPTPPIHVSSAEEFNVEYYVVITKGEVARSVVASLYVPPEFELPGVAKPLIQPLAVNLLAGYKTSTKPSTTYIAGMNWRVTFQVKAAAEPGTYTLYSKLSCEGFQGNRRAIEVVVEE
jgi:ABC-type multidrug transport system fused ATPase/permease subunit